MADDDMDDVVADVTGCDVFCSDDESTDGLECEFEFELEFVVQFDGSLFISLDIMGKDPKLKRMKDATK